MMKFQRTLYRYHSVPVSTTLNKSPYRYRWVLSFVLYLMCTAGVVAEEIFLDFNDLPFDPDNISSSAAWDGTPLPVDQHDFYADDGLIFNCKIVNDGYGAEDCVTVVVWDRSNPVNKYLGWATQGYIENNRRMYLKFPTGANNISFEMGHLWEPGKVRVDYLDANERVIKTSYNVDSALGFGIADLQSWTHEEYWANSSQQFFFASIVPVYGVKIYAWAGNNVPGAGYIFDDALDNLRFDRLDGGVPDLPEELGCENENLLGNPCNVATGNKFHVETDFSVVATDLEFIRSYNSYANDDIGIGVGWTTNHHSFLNITAESATFRSATGRQETWLNINGEWIGDTDSALILTQSEVGYHIAYDDGSIIDFSLEGHQLSSKSAAGRLTSYLYDDLGQLQSIVGPYGHTITITHDDNGRVSSFTDPNGGINKFIYDQIGNLESVVFPDLTTRIYHYEEAGLPHHMTGITDENGSRFATYNYDVRGAAIRSSHADVGQGPQEQLSFNYDFSNGTTITTDAAGNQVRMEFETIAGAKRLTKSTNVTDSKEENHTYDSRGNRLSTVDADGRASMNTYNSSNQLISVTTAAGSSEEFTVLYEYVAPHLNLMSRMIRPSIAEGLQHVTNFEYDSEFNLIEVSETGYQPDGAEISRVTQIEYDMLGRVISITGPRDDVIDNSRSFAYHECTDGGKCGQISRVVDQAGHEVLYPDYDQAGRVISSINSNGIRKNYGYDVRGRLTSIDTIGPLGSDRTSEFIYDAVGQLLESIDADNVAINYTYDEAHNLVSVQDADGNTYDYGYDSRGNLISETRQNSTGSLSAQTVMEYDVRNFLSRIDVGGLITDFVNDSVGNILAITDPKRQTSNYDYSPTGRLRSVVDNSGNESVRQYNLKGQPVVAIASNGALTQYSYDDFGNLHTTASADRGQMEHTFDLAGNVVSSVDAKGSISDYLYDGIGRLVTVNRAGSSEDISFIYDECFLGVGMLCSIVDQTGTSDFEYDQQGNITSQTVNLDGVSYQIGYTYSAAGRLSNIVYPDGTSVSYSRGTAGRVEAIDCVGCEVASILYDRQYDASGLVTQQTFGNGIIETRQYDDSGRLMSKNTTGVDQSIYSRDANGNVLVKGSYKFTYDANNQIISEKISGKALKLTYDQNGNRLSNDKIRALYEPLTNRLIEYDGQPVSVDENGNTTALRDLRFEYDNSQRVSTVSSPEGVLLATYTYNAFGQRIKKTTESGSTLYFYDIAGRLLTERNTLNAVDLIYIWADDEPIAQRSAYQQIIVSGKGKNRVTTIDNGEALVFLHVDELLAPRNGTDLSGNLIWNWDYDSFGAIPADQDPDGDDRFFSINLRMPGQYYDSETELFYNHFRYYDPVTGRYIQSDPIGLAGGDNPYSYVENNPLSKIDPTGLAACYVSYPGYPVTYAPGRRSTWLGGHAGVFGFNLEGSSRYYEFGRYSPNEPGIVGTGLPSVLGNVRRVTVPDVHLDDEGNLTPESMREVTEFLSENVGRNTEVELQCDLSADENLVYSHIESLAANSDRPPYDWKPWSANHCRTFASDAVDAGNP